MSQIILNNKDIQFLAEGAALEIKRSLPQARTMFAIPRGGIPAAMAIRAASPDLEIVDDPDLADIFVDDIIDSGATCDSWLDRYPGKLFFALVNKIGQPAYLDKWVVFPWEHSAEGSIEDNIRRLLQFVGEDVNRGGLKETPLRVAKAWQQWCSGYGKDPASILKVFEDGAEKCDEMIIVKDIPFYSHCEHHLAQIFGTASIAYIPNGKIVGLSKLPRLVEVFARRLQVQERLTNQIADSIESCLAPVGVGVILRARHLCMESRGICQQGHITITSALRGAIKECPDARAEFIALA
jgi:GTP cyclohydrolase I